MITKKENNLTRLVTYGQIIQNDCQLLIVDAINAKKSSDCMDLQPVEMAFKRIIENAEAALKLTLDTYDEFDEEESE